MFGNENELENQAAEQVTESAAAEEPAVEVTTDAPAPKTFTQEEVDAIVVKAKTRARAMGERDAGRKYESLMHTLRAGTGMQTVEELDTAFREHYGKNGIRITGQQHNTDRDSEILGRAEAQEIIEGGLDEVVEETERLAKLGNEKMTPRERARFQALAEHRRQTERSRELQKIGVTEEELRAPEFLEFAGKFSSRTPVTEVYGMYRQLHPKQTPQAIGSLKNNGRAESKTYYSPEDVDRLTQKDWDDPVVFRNVRESMKKWK